MIATRAPGTSIASAPGLTVTTLPVAIPTIDALVRDRNCDSPIVRPASGLAGSISSQTTSTPARGAEQVIEHTGALGARPLRLVHAFVANQVRVTLHLGHGKVEVEERPADDLHAAFELRPHDVVDTGGLEPPGAFPRRGARHDAEIASLRA